MQLGIRRLNRNKGKQGQQQAQENECVRERASQKKKESNSLKVLFSLVSLRVRVQFHFDMS